MSCDNGKNYDLEIEQGTTWVRQIQIKDSAGTPINITGYTFRGQIRKSYSYATVIVAFTCTITDAALGKFNISLTDTQTAAIPVVQADNVDRPSTEYIYDIEWISSGGIVERLMQGQVYVSPEVTR